MTLILVNIKTHKKGREGGREGNQSSYNKHEHSISISKKKKERVSDAESTTQSFDANILTPVGTLCVGPRENVVAVEEAFGVERGAGGHQVPQPPLRDPGESREVEVLQLWQAHTDREGPSGVNVRTYACMCE